MEKIYGHGVNDMPRGCISHKGKHLQFYKSWFSMMTRCYSDKFKGSRHSYEGCYVCVMNGIL